MSRIFTNVAGVSCVVAIAVMASQTQAGKNDKRNGAAAGGNVTALAGGGVPIHISEIRIDEPATDNNEYFELSGTPGASLAGLTYIVIGDGVAAAGSGVVEEVTSLNGQVIPPSGHFLAAENTFTLGPADLTTALDFENDDNTTHMLVEGFFGASGNDLDTNNDGVLDSTPWTAVHDVIALIRQQNPPTLTEFHYGPPTIGPKPGTTTNPWHVYRGTNCGAWIIGTDALSSAGGDDTPGAVNADCPPEYYFGLPHSVRGAAQLVPNPDGSLSISNIGSSGQDGVDIAVTIDSPPGSVSPGWAGVLDFGPAGGLAAGTVVKVGFFQTGDTPVQEQRFAEMGGGQTAVSLEQSLCPQCPVTVQLLLNGEVVRTAVYPPPYPPVLAIGNIGSSGQDGVEVSYERQKGAIVSADFDYRVGSRFAATPITLAGGLPPMDADELRIGLNGLPPGTRYIGNISITASNPNSTPVIISNEALLMPALMKAKEKANKMVCAPHGAVQVTGVGDLDGDGEADIQISNIGSSGQDGVSLMRKMIPITQNEASGDGIAVEVDLGQAGALNEGGTTTFSVRSRNTSSGVATFDDLSITAVAGGSAIVSAAPCDSPDCCQPCCPCAGVTVQAILHGVLVDEVVHAVLPPTIASGNIGSSGQDGIQLYAALIDSAVSIIDDRFILGLRQYDPTMITLTGSPLGPVMATEIRVRRGSVSASNFKIMDASLSLTSTGPVTLHSGTIQAVLSPDVDLMGLPHEALGQALLSPNADGSLHISNIGSSGQDGVAIGLGEVGRWFGEIDVGPVGAAFTDGRYVLRAGIPLRTDSALGFAAVNGGQVAVSFEQDICPTCLLHVELLRDGAVVGNAVYPPPYPASLVVGNIGSSGQDGVSIALGHDSLSSSSSTPMVVNSIIAPMSLSGQAPVDAQAIRISLNGLPPGVPVDGLTDVSFHISGQTEKDLLHESVSLSAHPVSSLGQASIRGSRDNHLQGGVDVIQALRVSNIGSSGQDGVSIRDQDDDGDSVPDIMEDLNVVFNPLTVINRSSLVVHAHGTGGNFLAGAFFDVFYSISGTGGPMNDVHVDWGVYAGTFRVEIRTGGATVLAVPGQSGPSVGQVPSSAMVAKTSEAKMVLGGINASHSCSLHFDAPVPIQLSSGDGAVGDELAVIAENPLFSSAGIETVNILASNLPGDEFIITDVTSLSVNDCPADANNNNVVDIDDLVMVITSWSQTGPIGAIPADVTRNGVVNIDDLVQVIVNWGGCS